mmetsp:Transcript_30941/g.89075  ORF Transcript_30941/g.89075 Transcript_30941/m.89075 type:complete len:221 (+) Transcript_30941:87-749(+)
MRSVTSIESKFGILASSFRDKLRKTPQCPTITTRRTSSAACLASAALTAALMACLRSSAPLSSTRTGSWPGAASLNHHKSSRPTPATSSLSRSVNAPAGASNSRNTSRTSRNTTDIGRPMSSTMSCGAVIDSMHEGSKVTLTSAPDCCNSLYNKHAVRIVLAIGDTQSNVQPSTPFPAVSKPPLASADLSSDACIPSRVRIQSRKRSEEAWSTSSSIARL